MHLLSAGTKRRENKKRARADDSDARQLYAIRGVSQFENASNKRFKSNNFLDAMGDPDLITIRRDVQSKGMTYGF